MWTTYKDNAGESNQAGDGVLFTAACVCADYSNLIKPVSFFFSSLLYILYVLICFYSPTAVALYDGFSKNVESTTRRKPFLSNQTLSFHRTPRACNCPELSRLKKSRTLTIIWVLIMILALSQGGTGWVFLLENVMRHFDLWDPRCRSDSAD